ncbi:MAG: glycosyltransferase [Coriobacteriia bacterium]|nr:glycosyltransferase [Coriobacteriia bacterium]
MPRRRDVLGWRATLRALESRMRAADVIHWYFGRSVAPLGLDSRLVLNANRPGVVEFLGSDVRDPAVECTDNPYYAAAFGRGYEYMREESSRSSRRVQMTFLRAGFVPVVPNGVVQYLIPAAREVARVIERGVLLEDYPLAQRPSNEVPVVVHAPSAPVAKGTEMIEAALDSLRGDVEFEYVRLEGVPRREALATMMQADVVVDQVVLGDYGMAAIEAMALAKPVVAWVKPAIRVLYPPDLPVVDARVEDLPQVLHRLLTDPELRTTIGTQGRRFVERYHNARLRAREMMELYLELTGGPA